MKTYNVKQETMNKFYNTLQAGGRVKDEAIDGGGMILQSWEYKRFAYFTVANPDRTPGIIVSEDSDTMFVAN